MTSVDTTTSTVTVEELFTIPLGQLLAQLNVEIHDASIADPNFYGVVVARTGHPLLLLMPVGRDEFEHDTCARKLLGDALGLQLTPLPGSLETLVLTDFTDKVNAKAAQA